MPLIYKIEIDKQSEQMGEHQGGWGGGINWETGIDIIQY